jgi:hypothetical protein
VAGAAKAAGTAQGVSFGVNAKRLMPLDQLTFDAVALVA